MPTMESVVSQDSLFTMLKGEPGTRKSTCALSYPKPQYWISTDHKMEALTLPMKRWGIKPSDITFDDYKDWSKPEAKLEQFKVQCPFKTIIVDSITSFADNINRETRAVKAQSGGGKKIGNISVDGLEEYNAEAAAFQTLIAYLKDIHKYHKVHVILIAHVVGQRKDDTANKLTHHSRVIITGGDKIAGKISSYMTEVYHFNVDTGFNADDQSDSKFALFTQFTGNDYARTSLPLERKIVFHDEPLYDRWIAPAQKRLREMPSTIVSIPDKVEQKSGIITPAGTSAGFTATK